MTEFSVIIPAYNEGETIFQNLITVSKTIRAEDIDFEIILVDDGSSDNTFAEAKRASEHSKEIRVVYYEPNAGKGAAFKKGFDNSSGKYIALLDADLDFHPSQLLVMLSRLKCAEADMVIGSKYHSAQTCTSEVQVSGIRRF